MRVVQESVGLYNGLAWLHQFVKKERENTSRPTRSLKLGTKPPLSTDEAARTLQLLRHLYHGATYVILDGLCSALRVGCLARKWRECSLLIPDPAVMSYAGVM